MNTTVWTGRIMGRVISKKNSRFTTRSGRSFPSKAYTAWHDEAGYQLLPSRPIEPITGPTSVVLDFTYASRLHWNDLDNQISSVLDLIQDVGVIANDRDVMELHARRIKDIDWSVTITIRPLIEQEQR